MESLIDLLEQKIPLFPSFGDQFIDIVFLEFIIR